MTLKEKINARIEKISKLTDREISDYNLSDKNIENISYFKDEHYLNFPDTKKRIEDKNYKLVPEDQQRIDVYLDLQFGKEKKRQILKWLYLASAKGYDHSRLKQHNPSYHLLWRKFRPRCQSVLHFSKSL